MFVSTAVKFFFLLVAIAAVQGSSMKDLAVEYSQMLAEDISEGVEEVTRLTETSVDSVTKQHQDTLQKLLASAHEKVEVTASKCSHDAKEEVHHQVTQSVTGRFLNCINFTDQIEVLEKMIYNVSQEVGSVESGICLAITNLTSCTGEIVDEIHCVSAGILAYINDFKNHKNAISDTIYKFNEELRQIGNQFLKCFTTVDDNVVSIAQSFVATKC